MGKSHYIACSGGLMDKVMDSGSIDAGSIPVRNAKRELYDKTSCNSFLLKMVDICNKIVSSLFDLWTTLVVH